MPSIGIAGAGLAGRLLAFALCRRGWRVTLCDRDTRAGQQSCGLVAAGMLAPYAELETAESLVFSLGKRSLQLWPQWLAELEDNVFFQQHGTLLVAHRQDQTELQRFVARIRAKLGNQAEFQFLEQPALETLEPELAGRFRSGVFFPTEGQVNTTEFFPAIEKTLLQDGVCWHEKSVVDAVLPGKLLVNGEAWRFDWTADTRGMGAKETIPGLRGVRGEIITVQAPEVKLQRLVRLMHPRYPLYLAPRLQGLFVIGATSIESADRSPISVQSALELLSAAYTVHSGFAEARIINMATQLRPTLPNHLPRIFYQSGLIRINGLYRHGYLQGPAIVEDTVRLLEEGKSAMHFPELLSETADVDRHPEW